MITLSTALALTLYLGAFLSILSILWFFNYKTRAAKSKLPPLSTLFICEYCQFPYLDKTAKPVTQCPQCSSFNKKNSYTNH